jgi:ribosomal protein L11 methyltransferase
LCLQALEEQSATGERLLDVGSGSGILLSAAVLLGAKTPVGCDIDAEATGVAKANLERDGVAARLFNGSLRAIAAASVSLLVANLNATTHELLAANYARVATRLAVLSGYPQRHAARVRAALADHGWNLHTTLTQEDWICDIFTPGGGF